MIVYSKERYIPTLINTLVLQRDGSYYYVHRDVYDKAVTLADRHRIVDLKLLVNPRSNFETIDFFFNNAPSPLNILAPYLGLLEGELDCDMELCCGALHQITKTIDVKSFIDVPAEVRKSISFSLSIKEEYEMSWDEFFHTSIPYEERNGMRKTYINEERKSGESKPDIAEDDNNWVPIGGGYEYNVITGETAYNDELDTAKTIDDLARATVAGSSTTQEVQPIESMEQIEASRTKSLFLE